MGDMIVKVYGTSMSRRKELIARANALRISRAAPIDQESIVADIAAKIGAISLTRSGIGCMRMLCGTLLKMSLFKGLRSLILVNTFYPIGYLSK